VKIAIFEPNLFPYKYSNILKRSQSLYLSPHEDGTEYYVTSAYKIQTLGNYPEENIQLSPLTAHDALSNAERWEKLSFYQLDGLFIDSVMVTIKMGGGGLCHAIK